MNARQYREGELEQRIRDLEAELGTSRRQFTTLARSIDGLRSRAERAEAELLHARGISEIREAERDDWQERAERAEADLHIEMAELFDTQAERDKLTAKLDRKRLIHVLWDQVPEDWDENDIGILVDAILADTDEGNEQ